MGKVKPLPLTEKRAVLYLRQSVARDDSISIELQEIAGRDHCVRQGYGVVAIEVDEGLSGRNWSKRPAVQRVLDMIERKEADVIVLWKWSRLSRNRKDWALAADRVDVAGGMIESATEPIDTATASGRFARGVMTEYSAFQSEQIGEQWKEVFARRAKLGLKPFGTPPWGWEGAKDGATITPENAAVVRAMYGLYAEGRGLVYIANWMTARGLKTRRGKTWQFASVRSCLESPFHAGVIVYDGNEYVGAHRPIITREEYDRFMQGRTNRSTVKRPRVSPYLLSTICVCHCGRKRVGNVSSKRKRSYGCTAAEPHKNKYRVCSAVDDLVSEWVQSIDVPAIIELESSPVDTRMLDAEITRIDKGITNLTTMLALEQITAEEYVSAKAALSARGAGLHTQRAEAARRSINAPSKYLSGKAHLVEAWPLMTTEERQPLLRSLVEYVTIFPDETIDILTRWGEVVHKGSS